MLAQYSSTEARSMHNHEMCHDIAAQRRKPLLILTCRLSLHPFKRLIATQVGEPYLPRLELPSWRLRGAWPLLGDLAGLCIAVAPLLLAAASLGLGLGFEGGACCACTMCKGTIRDLWVRALASSVTAGWSQGLLQR